MKDTIEDRARRLGVYVLEKNATVRSAAKHFGLSKSTVHKDITQKLRESDYSLYLKVRRVLDINKQERHIRGGLATKAKYQALSQTKKQD